MKPGGKSGAAARPGGGFRQGFGGFNEAHMEEQASQSAAKQQQQTQQGTSSTQNTTGGSALKHQGSGSQTATSKIKQRKPREVSGLTEELVKRPAKDIVEEFKAFFDLNSILGIQPGDTEEEQAKKKQTLQRWQKLDQEQQEVAQKKYQAEMQKKKQGEEEKEEKKRLEEQQKAQSIQIPSGSRKGPIGPSGSKKQKAAQQLQQNRQSLGKVQGSN